MAFGPKDRIPVRPLDYKESNNGEKALNKELMVDYDSGKVYVKDSKGGIHDVYSTDQTSTIVMDSITKDPSLITGAKLFEAGEYKDGESFTIKEAVSDIDNRIDTLEKLDHDKYFKKDENNIVSGNTTFNGIIVLKEGINYGDTKPITDNVEGRLFFLLLDEA